MRRSTKGSARILESLMVSTVTVAALGLLGCVLAYWTWRWLGPREEPRVQPLAEAPRIESAHELFGSAQRATAAPTASLA